jgi:sugar phosphate isomerase/epimerase
MAVGSRVLAVSVHELGTMVAYGFDGIDLADELSLARQFGAALLEILPEWVQFPDPARARQLAADAGLRIHSAHGCWGGQAIRARRVDLGSGDPITQRESIDDLKRCIDWVNEAGGAYLVVHPGGLSDPAESGLRRAALARGLHELAGHAAGSGIGVCVENMPPGVHPGSSMADLAGIVRELGHSRIGLALDTGHANLTSSAAQETLAAGSLLWTTHVHDNDGRQDTHQPPGQGTVDWTEWACALDNVGYTGPILLECIRRLRQNPSEWRPEVLSALIEFQLGENRSPGRL